LAPLEQTECGEKIFVRPCHTLPAIEVIHDVVFFPLAPIKPGYVLGDAAGSELFVAEVRIA
jgi:hypothetical protein